MTLYWYMHWFWITIFIVVTLCRGDDVVNTTIHSTTAMASEVQRTGKAISPFTVIPPIKYSPAKNITAANNKTQQTTKQITVIEPNVTSLNENLTNLTTESILLNTTTEDGMTNETTMTNSHRVIEEINEGGNGNLSAAGITGITLGCVSFVGILSAISYILYRNRGFNRPQVLSDHCSNLDSSGYIDDTSVRDNSEEMYSLDNDSFLNSLEAMTIQNYWTDTVKHTKL